MSQPASEARTERRSTHSVGNRFARGVWGLVQGTLFRFSPRPFHRWRNWLLRLFGAKLHPTARVYPRARIWAPWNLQMAEYATIGEDVDVYCPRKLRIGANSVVSQYSYLCGATHDFEKPNRPLVPLPITIGTDVWLAADVFVAPGVTIGDGAVVGARSSVFKDLEPWKVYMGSPARPVRDRVMATEAQDT
ncbi:MAG: hypothetical protein JSV91_14245 [Phycisphaerales bacterium]|nr:MAG: hypothetical protein JSV91_14245 [Phycisphaerales bacterium]